MKRFGLGFAFVLALAMNAMAGEWSGYIADSTCAKKMSASTTASAAHAACAQRCIKNGAAPVLVANDGKVYQIANPDKVIDDAGLKVAIEGDIDRDTITVTKVKPLSGK